MITAPAWAGFSLSGYDLQVVKSAQGLENADASYQTNSTWGTAGELVTTSFTLPSVETIAYARLYMDVWGGTNYKNAQAEVTINGTARTIAFGNTGDATNGIATTDTHPTYDGDATCVYGSGFGVWQLCLSDVADLLHTDGTANSVNVSITDPNATGFDGRVYDVSLVSIYQDPSIDQTLDFYLAEADGSLRRIPGTAGAPTTRSLTIPGINTTDVLSATYTAGYTHGTTDQPDQVYFNENDLDGDGTDVALGTSSDYGPSNVPFDVSLFLMETSTIRYSVDETEVGTPSEYSVRANVGLLTVTHPVPEPSTAVLLTLALAGGLFFFTKRRK
jgi:hypothetical protein